VTADQIDKVAVLADDHGLHLPRGLEYFGARRVSHAQVAQ
jgi:hypothetical protein